MLVFWPSGEFLFTTMLPRHWTADTAEAVKAFIIQFAVVDSVSVDEFPDVLVGPFDYWVYNGFMPFVTLFDNLARVLVVVYQYHPPCRVKVKS